MLFADVVDGTLASEGASIVAENRGATDLLGLSVEFGEADGALQIGMDRLSPVVVVPRQVVPAAAVYPQAEARCIPHWLSGTPICMWRMLPGSRC